MLMYSHDTFGLGHLQRCLKIATVLLERYPQLSILLATGSAVVHRFELPAGLDYIKLPAVRKVGPEDYEARLLKISYERILKLRTELLLNCVKTFQPDLLLVDHSPIGMKGEMLPTLKWLKKSTHRCSTMLGLRDIIDDPETVVSTWQRDNLYETIASLYDHILIYGNRELYDTHTEYKFPETLVSKTTYCNYIGERLSEEAQVHNFKSSDHSKKRTRKVFVTIGGGDGAGQSVIGNYFEMLTEYQELIDFETEIVTGPFLSESDWQKFTKISETLPVTLHRFVSSTSPFLAGCDLVVSTGGYNSIVQILQYAPKALIIPRVMHRKEQLMRAKRLAEVGLVSYLHPDEVGTKNLFAKITEALNSEEAPISKSRLEKRVRFDGAQNLADYCQPLIEQMTQNVEEVGVTDDV